MSKQLPAEAYVIQVPRKQAKAAAMVRVAVGHTHPVADRTSRPDDRPKPSQLVGERRSTSGGCAHGNGTPALGAVASSGPPVAHWAAMRALVQRVTRATVTVGAEVAGEIGPGLCVLVGVTHDDTEAIARKVAERVWHLRIMDDDAGVMNRSVADTTRQVLVVSQFTLYGDTSAGRRPSWIRAARPEQAEPLVAAVVDHLRRLGATVATGRFRATMAVELVNDGPTTVWLEL